MRGKDLYATLELEAGADLPAVKRAYRRLAFAVHPLRTTLQSALRRRAFPNGIVGLPEKRLLPDSGSRDNADVTRDRAGLRKRARIAEFRDQDTRRLTVRLRRLSCTRRRRRRTEAEPAIGPK